MISLNELRALREQYRNEIGTADGTEQKIRVVVGLATCGIAAGATPVFQAVKDEAAKRAIPNVTVVRTGCVGICQFEPVIEVYMPGKEKTTYVHMDAEKALRVFEEHVAGGVPVEEYTIGAALQRRGK